MANIRVKELAEMVGSTTEQLLTQFKNAEIDITDADQLVSSEQKQALLKYLRADFFQVEKAAVRMVNHLSLLYKYFGPDMLQRRLRFADLTQAEQDCIRTGKEQILPVRDRAGRLLLFAQGAMENVSFYQQVRFLRS